MTGDAYPVDAYPVDVHPAGLRSEALLGLPLPRALELLAAAGLPPPQVVETAAPRGQRQSGTLRVVAVSAQGRRLTVARFWDAMPGIPQARA